MKGEAMRDEVRFKKIRGFFAAASILICMPLIVLAMLIFPNHKRICRKTCRFFFPANRLKIERIGEFDQSAQILVLNHQSVVDITYIEGYYPWDVCWVAKKELGEIPLYGHALKVPKMILIDRESKKSLVLLLKEAKDRLENGRILAIFPEGTRSEGGREFLPFKDGAKILIEKYRLKLQPIVLVNTRKLFNSKSLEVSATTARAVCLPAYTPDFDDQEWYAKLKTAMQETYAKHYDELNERETPLPTF